MFQSLRWPGPATSWTACLLFPVAALVVLLVLPASSAGRRGPGSAKRPGTRRVVVRRGGGRARGDPGDVLTHSGGAGADEPGPPRLSRRRPVRDARVRLYHEALRGAAALGEVRRPGPYAADAQLLLVRADVPGAGPARPCHARGQQGPVRHGGLAQRQEGRRALWAASPPAGST